MQRRCLKVACREYDAEADEGGKNYCR